MIPPNSRSLVDLFAGCGGLSLGLELAGFWPIFVNELNQDAMESYLLNRDHINPLLRSKYHVYDVKDLVLQPSLLSDLICGFKQDYGIRVDRGDLDLLVGGPPCQGFSRIGHRRSYSVDKQQLPSNYLFEDMAYVLNRLRPKLFVFENVQGLLNAKWTSDGTNGEIWHEVQHTFASIEGYTVQAKLVYAKDFGVPQNRPRILLIGIRNDVSAMQPSGTMLHPEPIGGYPTIPELLDDLVDSGYKNGGATLTYPKPAQNDHQRELRRDPISERVRAKGKRVSEQDYARHTERIVEKFRHMIEHDGDIPVEMQTKKFAQKVLPRNWGSNGPSITVTSMPDDYVHYAQPRILTVREWSRLQLFPDWYRFAGKKTTGGIRRAGNPRLGLHDREVPKYTQIGNAVPVGLARELGRKLMMVLEAADA